METVEQPLDLTRSDSSSRRDSSTMVKVASDRSTSNQHSLSSSKEVDELKRASSTFKQQATLSSYNKISDSTATSDKLKQRVMLPHKLRHRELSHSVPETDCSQQLVTDADQLPVESRSVPKSTLLYGHPHQRRSGPTSIQLDAELDGPSSQTRVVLDPVDDGDVAMQMLTIEHRMQTAASLGGSGMDYRRRLADGGSSSYVQQPPSQMAAVSLPEDQHRPLGWHHEQLLAAAAAAASQRANFSGFGQQVSLSDNLAAFALRQQSHYGVSSTPAAARELAVSARIAMPPFQTLVGGGGGGGIRNWQQATTAHLAALEPLTSAAIAHQSGEMNASEAAALKSNVAAAYLLGMPPPLVSADLPPYATTRVPSPLKPSSMLPLLISAATSHASSSVSSNPPLSAYNFLSAGSALPMPPLLPFLPRMHDVIARSIKTDVSEPEHRCCDQALCSKCVRDNWQSSSSASSSAFNHSTPPSPAARLSMDSRSDLMSLPSPLTSPYPGQDPRSPAMAPSGSERYGYEARLSAEKLAALGGAAFSINSNKSPTMDLRTFAPRIGLGNSSEAPLTLPKTVRFSDLVPGSITTGALRVPSQMGMDSGDLAKNLLEGSFKRSYKRQYEPTSTPYERSVGIRKKQRLDSKRSTSSPSNISHPIYPATTVSTDVGVPSTSGDVPSSGYPTPDPAIIMKPATAAAAVPIMSPQAQQARNSDAAVLRRWHTGLHFPTDTNFADMASSSGGRSLLTVNWSVMSGGAMRVCSTVPATAAAAALARDSGPVTSTLPVVRRILNTTDSAASRAVIVDF